MMKQRPLLVFFPLAFLLSWYPYILGKTHLVRTSGGMNPLGVMVAAVVVAAVYYRGAGVKELMGRYLRWRIGWTNYIFALLLPAVIVTLSAILNVLLGAAHPTRAQLEPRPEILPGFVFIFLFIGVGEETGWRGFALPELQKRFSPLAASLIIGVIWAAWHIPLMGFEFQRPIIPPFLLGILSGSVLSTWLFNHSRGSLVPQPLFHATVNTLGAGYVFRMFHSADVTRLWWIYTALWVLAALVFVLRSPRMIVRPTYNSSLSRV